MKDDTMATHPTLNDSRHPARRCITLCALSFALSFALAATPSLHAQTSEPAELRLEDLLQAEVVSAGRKPQALRDVPAAVYVLSAEDIRRSGATSLPEALRFVPGMEVAQIGAGQWAVSARGFNSRFANKLLVLIDGRSVYSPLFSGVYWEAEDLLLEDVERIEIVRGPGAAMWGANAVNGVVNVITKRARETAGTLLMARPGTQGPGELGARQGFAWGAETTGRIWLKHRQERTSGDLASDETSGWITRSAGLRIDQNVQGIRRSLQAGLQRAETSAIWPIATAVPPFERTARLNQGNRKGWIAMREDRTLGTGELGAQLTLSDENNNIDALRERRRTYDADLQYGIRWSAMQELVVGVNVRHTRDEVQSSTQFIFAPENARSTRWGLFAQNDWSARPDQLKFSFGARLERVTGLDVAFQPNVRALLKLNPRQSVWFSLARADRLPSRGEESVDVTATVLPPGSLPGAPALPVEVRVRGSGTGNYKSEVARSLDLGWRAELSDSVSLDAVVFTQKLKGIRSTIPLGPPTLAQNPARLILPSALVNGGEGHSRGAELALDARINESLRIAAGMNLLKLTISDVGGSVSEPVADLSPRQQQFVRSFWSVSPAMQLDASLKRTGEILDGQVPAYTKLDLRAGYRVNRSTELSIAVLDATARKQKQFGRDIYGGRPVVVDRSAYIKALLRY